MNQIRIRVILSVFIVVFACGYGVFNWYRNHLDSGHMADQCEQRVKQTIDPDALQLWATKLLEQYPPGRTNYTGPFILPAGLATVWEQGQPSVYLREANNREEPYVYVFWGSGVLGHWGLSIGSPTFVPGNPENGSRLWKPGIYFFRNPH